MGKVIYQPVIVEKEKKQGILPEFFQKDIGFSCLDEIGENIVMDERDTLTKMEKIPNYEEVFAQASEDGFIEGEKKGYIDGHKEGHQAGYREGKNEALLEVEKNWQQKQKQLSELILTFTQKRKEAIDQVTDEFIPVVFSAVAKIVGELAPSPEFVRSIVRQALQGVRSVEQVSIKLHPVDVKLLSETESIFEQYPQLSIEEDDSILAGCIIETNCGNINAQLDTQLTQLKILLSKMRTG